MENEQPTTLQKFGKGLMKGLMWGAIIGGIILVAAPLPGISGAITSIISTVNGLAASALSSVGLGGLVTTIGGTAVAQASAAATTAAGVAAKAATDVAAKAAAGVAQAGLTTAVAASSSLFVAAAAAIGGLVGGFRETTKEPSKNYSANAELAQARMQTAALGAIVQEQQRALETVVEQSAPTLAGQPLVLDGPHAKALESRRGVAVGVNGPAA
ncbi:MAG: hypothetical protein EBR02_01950 [Alphaproteobacteria bacterium]|nr:hypothetical protein [Alphaproteobacteria bacterium]